MSIYLFKTATLIASGFLFLYAFVTALLQGLLWLFYQLIQLLPLSNFILTLIADFWPRFQWELFFFNEMPLVLAATAVVATLATILLTIAGRSARRTAVPIRIKHSTVDVSFE